MSRSEIIKGQLSYAGVRRARLTGRIVVSRCPQSTTRPVTDPVDMSASTGADAKLKEGTCGSRGLGERAGRRADGGAADLEVVKEHSSYHLLHAGRQQWILDDDDLAGLRVRHEMAAKGTGQRERTEERRLHSLEPNITQATLQSFFPNFPLLVGNFALRQAPQFGASSSLLPREHVGNAATLPGTAFPAESRLPYTASQVEHYAILGAVQRMSRAKRSRVVRRSRGSREV